MAHNHPIINATVVRSEGDQPTSTYPRTVHIYRGGVEKWCTRAHQVWTTEPALTGPSRSDFMKHKDSLPSAGLGTLVDG